MIQSPADPTSVHPACPPRAARKKCRAFTLVETALALGIVAFALVPLVGLLPLGLQISGNASDLTLTAQIAQRLAGMIHQADYSNYPALANVYYYFDGEGQPVKQAGGTVPPSAIYTASIFLPSPDDPPATLVDGANVVTLRIQIVNDPVHRLQGTPSASLRAELQARSVTVPVYLANNGG